MTHNMNRTSIHMIALVVGALALCPATLFGGIVAAPTLEMQLQAGSDVGTWTVDLPNTGDPYNWQLKSPVSIYSSTNPELLLGTVESFTVDVDPDPFVALNFAVTAGAAPTLFTITSPVVAFAPIVNGLAFASAGISATEGGAILDGASATGTFAGVKAFQARYNAGTGIFANLVSPVIVAPEGGSNTVNERLPPPIGTRLLVPGATSDIQAEFSFTLSAFDLAGGNGRFDIIVPEPSSLALAVVALVGACALVARKRRSA